MAYPAQLIEPVSGRSAMAFHGFSWTCLFFGPFPALFRGHIVGFLIMLVPAFFTAGLSGILFGFIYNGMHRNWLLAKGFRAPAASGFGFASQNVINLSVGNVAGVSTIPSNEGATALDRLPVLPTKSPQAALPRH